VTFVIFDVDQVPVRGSIRGSVSASLISAKEFRDGYLKSQSDPLQAGWRELGYRRVLDVVEVTNRHAGALGYLVDAQVELPLAVNDPAVHISGVADRTSDLRHCRSDRQIQEVGARVRWLSDRGSGGTGDHHLEGSCLGRVREHVVGGHEFFEGEVVGDETARIELTGGHETTQRWRRVGVNQARCDGDIPRPQGLKMEHGWLAVDTDIGDVSAGPYQLSGELEGRRQPHSFDGNIRA